MVVAVLAFTISEGFLETLKLTREEAESAVWDCFSLGNYVGPAAPVYHNFSRNVQVAMVKEIGAFAKAYSTTEDFKNHYAEYREGRKPNPPEPFRSVTALRIQQHDGMTATVKDLESRLSSYSGDIRKTMEQTIAALKQQLKEIDDPKNPMFSAETEELMKKAYDEGVKEYEMKLNAWQTENPESPRELIKKRLTDFLQLSATVDFNAKLQKGMNDKMVFVNPDYESKDYDWKYIFRSGKDATAAARVVASQWLTELK